MRRLFALDTNLYVDALRTDPGQSALSAFQSSRTGFIVMNAIVAHELRAGACTADAVERIETEIIAPFERRRRLVVPTFWAWRESGRILSAIISPREWDRVPRSFVNDTLLAMSCREAGVVLVTRNIRDCERIARVRKFDFVPPWP